jgi:hypothetical protein
MTAFVSGNVHKRKAMAGGLAVALLAALALSACAPGMLAAGPVAAAGSVRSAIGYSRLQAGQVRSAAGSTPVVSTGSAISDTDSISDTVHPVEYRGYVEFLPGDVVTGTWQIGGRMVNVSGLTDLKEQLGALTRGAYVQVIGRLRPDGTIDATKLLVKKYKPGLGAGKDAGEPTPTPEAGATVTPTVEAGATASPTPEAGAVVTPTVEAGDDDQGEQPEQPDDEADGSGMAQHWTVREHGQVVTATVSGITTTLKVDGQTVVISTTTWVKSQWALQPGHWVQVKGVLQSDGSILATSIQWVHRVPEKNHKQEPVLVRPTATPGAPQSQEATGKAPGGKGQGSKGGHGQPAGKGQGNGKGHR